VIQQEFLIFEHKRNKKMEINDELIDKLARLSRLEYDLEGKEAVKKDLNQMIAFIEKINELDTVDVKPLVHITDEVNVFREDKVKKLTTKAEALQNAPLKNEDYIKVSKVLDK